MSTRSRRTAVAAVLAIAGGACLDALSEDVLVGRAPPPTSDAGATGSTDAGTHTVRRYKLFLSDDFRDDWATVQAVLVRIETVSPQGVVRVAWEEPFGLALDLRELHDAGGPVFRLLAEAGSDDVIDRFRVVLVPQITLRSTTDNTLRTVVISPAVPRDAAGYAVVEAPLVAPRDPGETGQLVIDFDLSQFTLEGDRLTPVVREREAEPVREAKAPVLAFGRITAVLSTSRDPALTVRLLDERTIDLDLDASTIVIGESGLPPPSFSVGQRVRVNARWNPATGRYLASRVDVIEGPAAWAQGTASAVATPRRTIEIPVETGEFVPPGITLVQATLSGVTRCLDAAGHATSCAALVLGDAVGRALAVTGFVIDGGAKWTAVSVREVGSGEATVEGARSAWDPVTRTLTLDTLTRSDGLPVGTTRVEVEVGATALVRDGSGEPMLRTEFDEAVGRATKVIVRGTVASGAPARVQARDVRATAP